MMRVFRLVLWFVLGFSFSAVPLLAFAESIPATSAPEATTVPALVMTDSPHNMYGSDGLAMCVFKFGGTATYGWNAGAGQGTCKLNGGWQVTNPIFVNTSAVCVTGDPGYGRGCSTVLSCPSGQNWTLNGSTCTRPDCSSGQMRDPATGLCINDCNGAAAKALNNSWVTGVGSSPASGSVCSGGCFYGASTCGSWSAGGVTKFVCKTTAATGSNCSGQGISQALAGEAACAEKGEGTGTVNGITVCAGKFDSTKTEGTTTTTPPGGGASTTKNETTTCSGGKCTTTTTETISGGGGTTTGTVEQDEASFCRQNPTHPACKAEEKNYCDDNPETAGCKELGDPGIESNLSSEAKGVSSITAASLASNASCPADIQLPKGMKFEWSPICQWAEALRPIVLALAWLAAGIIVLGGSF